jgi:hypothetical protein
MVENRPASTENLARRLSLGGWHPQEINSIDSCGCVGSEDGAKSRLARDGSTMRYVFIFKHSEVS